MTPKYLVAIAGACSLITLAGCQSASQTLEAESAAAQQTALARGQFDLSCPNATATVLSRNLVNPVLNGPMMNGVQRAEYTVGVSGCGQKAVYISVCQIGSVSCIAAASRQVAQ